MQQVSGNISKLYQAKLAFKASPIGQAREEYLKKMSQVISTFDTTDRRIGQLENNAEKRREKERTWLSLLDKIDYKVQYEKEQPPKVYKTNPMSKERHMEQLEPSKKLKKAKILYLIELSKTFVNVDNLDEAVETAVDNPVSFNFDLVDVVENEETRRAQILSQFNK